MCIVETQLFKKCWDYFTASQSSGTLVIGSECGSGSGEWRWCTDLRCCWVANNKTKFLVPASSFISTSVLITCVDRDSVHCFCPFLLSESISIALLKEVIFRALLKEEWSWIYITFYFFGCCQSEENFWGDISQKSPHRLIGLGSEELDIRGGNAMPE